MVAVKLPNVAKLTGGIKLPENMKLSEKVKLPSNLRLPTKGDFNALLAFKKKMGKRFNLLVLLVTALCFTIIVSPIHVFSPGISNKSSGASIPPGTNGIGNLNAYFPNKKINSSKDYYYKLFHKFAEARPVTPPKDIKVYRDNNKCKNLKETTYYSPKSDFTETCFENLNNCYKLTDSQRNNLRMGHRKILEFIKNEIVPFKNSIAKKLWKNEKGIVTIGGGRFSVIAYTMIKTLRDRGTTLPVEVLMPKGVEADNDFCIRVLPELNAKCIHFHDGLPKEFADFIPVNRFQYKAIAIMVSSFKKAIFIDADNLPIKSLDNVFDTSAFKKFGLIIWPDIWRRVTAPVYYDIADIKYNMDKRVRYMSDDISPVSRYDNVENPSAEYKKTKIPFHDFEGTLPELTSESGQLIIDKPKHLDTLTLMFYYNYYGPRWYYRLFTQGGSGEGDKETYIAAAHALNNPYYQVKTNVEIDGYFHKEGDFKGIGLFQHDFEQDYKLYQSAKTAVARNFKHYSKFDPDYDFSNSFTKSLIAPANGKEIDTMFVHFSFHKLSPLDLSKDKNFMKGDQHVRAFSKFSKLNYWDLELETTKIMEEAFCKESTIEFAYHKDKTNTDEWKNMCSYLENRLSYLQNTHDISTQQNKE